MQTYRWSRGLFLFALLATISFSAALFAQDIDQIQIRLQQTQFDPLQQSPPIPRELSSTGSPRAGGNYYLVQFEGPIRSDWRVQIAGMGATVIDYVPDFAYIVRMDQGARGSIESLSQVRWVGLFHPAYRVDGELWDAMAKPRGQNIELIIRGFSGESAPVIRGVLEGFGANLVSQSPDHGGGAIFRARLPEAKLLDLAHLEAVAWIEPYREPGLLNEIARSAVAMNKDGVESVLGLYGQGQTVAVGDTGLSTGDAGTVHQDFEGRVFGGGTGPGSTCGGWADNHSHGTHVAGSVLGSGFHSGADIPGQDYAGSNAGIAPEAQVYAWSFCNDFTGLPDAPYDDYYGAIRDTDTSTRVNTNSWGFTGGQGGYNTFTRETDRFVWDFPDMVLTYAAGNDGVDGNSDGVIDPNSMNMPATAKNVITVGASENLRDDGLSPGNPNAPCGTWGACWPSDFPAAPVSGDPISDNVNGMAAFSGRGPTNAGRLKPDIVAPGANILSASNESTQGSPGDWWYEDPFYEWNLGTSMATPLVAGASAIVREFYDVTYSIDPGAALVKATLINGAADMTPGQYGAGATQDVTQRPDNNQGWGRVDMVNSLVYDDTRGLEFEEHAGLNTGDDHQISLFVGDAAPFRATLVWADFPGTEASDGALTNDLDLIIQAPDGTYLGNEVITGGGADRDNNVEGVDLNTPVAGEYTITVEGFNVPEGPQPFALVVTGNFGGFAVDPAAAEVCAAAGDVDFTLTLSGQFDGTTDLSVTGEPAGTSGNFVPNPVVSPDDQSIYTLSGLGSATGGDYTLEFTATDAGDPGNTATNSADLSLFEANPDQVVLQGPADSSTNVGLQPEFTWDAALEAAEYQIQVATDAGFTSIVIDEVVESNSFTPESDLDTGTDHFWRVRALNACGDGDWSTTFEFQTQFEPVPDVNPESFDFVLDADQTDSDILTIANIGTGELEWSIVTDQITSLPPGLFDHDPALDEAIDIPDFTLTGGSDSQSFTIPAGVATNGDVVGFSFVGTVAGVSDTGSWASDMCMIIEAPDGTTYGVGGISGTQPECGNTNSWDFQGGGSTDDGTYESEHDDVFDPPLEDEGEWTFTFIDDWGTSTATMDWTDVAVTLHKQPLPFCIDPVTDADWLSVTPDAGTTTGGDSSDVTVEVDTAGMAGGSYPAALCIETNDPDNELIVVPVNLEIPLGPVADLSPASFSFTVEEDGMDDDVLNMGNIGDEDLVWSIEEAEPAGVRGGPVTTLLDEDFEGSFPPADWSTIDDSDPSLDCAWQRSDGYDMDDLDAPSLGAAADSDTCGQSGIAFGDVDTSLLSPELDLTGLSNAQLAFDFAFRVFSTVDEFLDIDVSTDGGGSWTTIQTYQEDIGGPSPWTPQPQTVDLSAYDGEPSVMLRWRYVAGWDYWVFIDNLVVTADGGGGGACASPTDIPWLSVDNAGDTTPPMDSLPVTVSVDATGLALGDYDALLCVTTNDTNNALVEVPVSLTVEDAPPEIDVDPESFTVNLNAGDATMENLSISNLGQTPLTWTIEEAPGANSTVDPRAHVPAEPRHAKYVGDPAARADLASALPEGALLPGLPIRNSIQGGLFDCDSEPGIIIQDNGSVNNGYGGNQAAGVTSSTYVDRYTPSAYPATFTGVCVGFITVTGPTSWDIEVVAFADDGPGGEPGTELGSVAATVTVEQVSPPLPPGHQAVWNTIDISSMELQIESGDVYIGIRWAPAGAAGANVFVASDEDTDNPVGHAGGWNRHDTDNIWSPTEDGFENYRALMVRPIELSGGCSAPEDVPWLSVSDTSGSTDGGMTSDVEVTLDASSLTEGSYEAFLCIASDDPVNDLVSVPITLNVTDPSAGTLEGTVTSAGYCGADPHPVEGAEIAVPGYPSVFTDSAGFYTMSISADDSPVDVTVTAGGYVGDSATGVEIEIGETTVQDFDLALDAPCATVDPESLAAEVGPDGVSIQTLTVGNDDGGADLAWNIEIAEAGDSARGGDIVVFDDVNFVPDAGTTAGGSVQWTTGDTCQCDTAPFNFNMWTTGDNLAFFWPLIDGVRGGGVSLDGGTTYAVLEPGDTVGPGSDFISLSSAAAAANWRQAGDVDGYLGFEFINPDTAATNYGYVHITTTGTTGHPVTVVGWAYNQAGDPITVGEGAGGCAAPEDVVWLSVDPDNGTTPAGGTSDVTVNFNAAGLATGDYEALLCVNSDDANNPQIEVPVTLSVLDQEPAILAVDPGALDFGDVAVDGMSTMSFDVSNDAAAGAADLTLTAITAGGDAEFSVTGGDCEAGVTSLAPGDSCTVEVTFAPGAVAAFSGDVTVEGNGQMEVVALSGMGVDLPSGELELSPADLAFGNVPVGDTEAGDLTLTNIGEDTAAVLVSSILVSGTGGAFSDTGNGSCEAGVTELEPGASCTIEIEFAPTDETSYAGSVVVDGSAPAPDTKLATATLSGVGGEPDDDIFSDRFEE